MNRGAWQELIDELRDKPYQSGVINAQTPVHKIEFDAGLTDEEVLKCEQRFDFRFPPDLRQFLQTALPRGPLFPDWRAGDETRLRQWLARPRLGVIFDVQHNDLWLEEWGHKPESLAAAVEVASEHLSRAPNLVPIFSHRMMPDEPHVAGNPVLSVHQSDIIRYGFDLADYLRREFGLPNRGKWPDSLRPTRFWSVFLS
jgi:hypothetical protein